MYKLRHSPPKVDHDYDTSSETSSEALSVCNNNSSIPIRPLVSCIKSGSSNDVVLTAATSKTKKKKKNTRKKRVRFNDSNRFFSGRRSGAVKATVHTIDRVMDPNEEVWWTASDMRAIRRAEASIAQTDAGVYLEESLRVFLRVTNSSTNGGNNDDDDHDNDATFLVAALACSDHGCWRGLEHAHGACGEQRQRRCQRTVRGIVRAYRKTNDHAAMYHSYKILRQPDEDEENDVDERVRQFALDLTESARNLASFYGKVDAMRVSE